MITIIHDFKKIIKISGNIQFAIDNLQDPSNISQSLYFIAEKFPLETIIWCHEKVLNNIDYSFIENLFIHNRYFLSFNPIQNYFSNEIGFVEDSPFIKVNKTVSYPTWQMSSFVGATKASTILQIPKKEWFSHENFDFTLNSIAKSNLPYGLFCYSEPRLLLDTTCFYGKIITPKASITQLFLFVASHYKWFWKHILIFNILIYKIRFPFFSWLQSLFIRKKTYNKIGLKFSDIKNKSNVKVESIDVIIPTIGREKYICDVLFDLKKQSFLPKKVIVVEQNPHPNSTSGLGFIFDTAWPFEIDHTFTNQPGACNARNIALSKVSSDWVFFADDDIRIDSDFFTQAFYKMQNLNANAVIFSCLLKNEVNNFLLPQQTTIFGSGCSIVKSEFTSKILFDAKYEFCFGEDTDYGMKLRNLGTDVIYLPEPKILHLKAPVGGFRTKPTYLWTNDLVLPKPSPTIMLNYLRYFTTEQQNGYKTLYFIKTINWKKPFQSFKKINKHWKSSMFWANKLENM